MDTSDIYYSDNSELIDNTNVEWMENTVLIENQDITWQEDGPEITVDYSEAAADVDQTLTENDGYLTADAEDSNETSQYFSILESNCDESSIKNNESHELKYITSESHMNPDCVVSVEIEKEEVILPDVTKIEAQDENEDEMDIEKQSPDQVMLYRMEGSDDLYAVQIADDGNGNFQKYQYKVRQTEDGQFEAVPGTIEIQTEDFNQMATSVQVHVEPDHLTNSHVPQKTEPPDIENNTISFIKTDIDVTEHSPEYLEEETADHSEDDYRFFVGNTHNSSNLNSEYLLQAPYEQEPEQEEEYQTVDGMHVTGDIESNVQEQEQEEVTFDATHNIYGEENSESEYEIEELEEDFQDETPYEDAEEEQVDNTDDAPQILQHKVNLVNVASTQSQKESKQNLPDNRNVTIFKDDKHLSYLVMKTNEKENVSLFNSKFKKANLRSILKTNCPLPKTKPITAKVAKEEKPKSTVPAIISNKETNKKVRNTQQVPAILVKSARQPRKQTIRPVERADSEIVVQPLIYSLDGDHHSDDDLRLFSAPTKRKRAVEEVYQVSDESDPEFTLKPSKKRKQRRSKSGRKIKQRKMIEITISDSEDDEMASDGSVIEVLTDEESIEESESEIAKRVRKLSPRKNAWNTEYLDPTDEETEIIDSQGVVDEPNNKKNDEPPTNKSNDASDNDDKKDNEKEVKAKTPQTKDDKNKNDKSTSEDELDQKPEPVKNSIGNVSRKNKCPMCPKTFPRLVNLKRHINLHSARRSLRSRTNITNKNDAKPVEESTDEEPQTNVKTTNTNVKAGAFTCTKCNVKLLSEIQLKRHQTIHNTKKQHMNGDSRMSLRRRVSPRKSTIKQIFISPKHLRSADKSRNETLKARRVTDLTVNNRQQTKESFKCEYCGLTFSQRTLLSVHRSTHKTFPCPNCKTNFTAKLLLDDHLRKNCVKTIINNKPIRQSPNKVFMSKKASLKCDVCNRVFTTPRSLQIHISVAHKSRPSTVNAKPVAENTSKRVLVKGKGAHGGVPMSLKMQKAFDKMKLKT